MKHSIENLYFKNETCFYGVFIILSTIWQISFLKKGSQQALKVIILLDLIFILLHILFKFKILSNPLFSIEMDRGFSEYFQYLKEITIAIFLLLAFKYQRHLTYLSWSCLFLYLFIDDSFSIHEDLGKYLVNTFNLPSPGLNLRPQDLGEIVVSFVFGSILLSFILYSYSRANTTLKTTSKLLAVMICLVAFFGVFIDLIHVAAPFGTSIWGLIEDGGEMITISFLVAMTYNLCFYSDEIKTLNQRNPI